MRSATTGSHVLTYNGHTAAVRTARWAPDGKHIASGGADESLQIWNPVTGQVLLTRKNDTSDILELPWALPCTLANLGLGGAWIGSVPPLTVAAAIASVLTDAVNVLLAA